MRRPEIIQSLLDIFNNPSYLEIGVNEGITFNELRAIKKVAVDPLFLFDIDKARELSSNNGAEFHQVPSDFYFAFARHRDITFDVIFLDGLHTFDQTLRDLLNAIECLNSGGVIIIDDVLPSSFAASLPEQERSFAFRSATGNDDQAWMGDVYRLIFFIKDYLSHYTYATHRENHGQTILWRQPRSYPGNPANIAQIAVMDFADAMIDKNSYNFCEFKDILSAVQDHVVNDKRNRAGGSF